MKLKIFIVLLLCICSSAVETDSASTYCDRINACNVCQKTIFDLKFNLINPCGITHCRNVCYQVKEQWSMPGSVFEAFLNDNVGKCDACFRAGYCSNAQCIEQKRTEEIVIEKAVNSADIQKRVVDSKQMDEMVKKVIDNEDVNFTKYAEKVQKNVMTALAQTNFKKDKEKLKETLKGVLKADEKTFSQLPPPKPQAKATPANPKKAAGKPRRHAAVKVKKCLKPKLKPVVRHRIPIAIKQCPRPKPAKVITPKPQQQAKAKTKSENETEIANGEREDHEERPLIHHQKERRALNKFRLRKKKRVPKSRRALRKPKLRKRPRKPKSRRPLNKPIKIKLNKLHKIKKKFGSHKPYIKDGKVDVNAFREHNLRSTYVTCNKFKKILNKQVVQVDQSLNELKLLKRSLKLPISSKAPIRKELKKLVQILRKSVKKVKIVAKRNNKKTKPTLDVIENMKISLDKKIEELKSTVLSIRTSTGNERQKLIDNSRKLLAQARKLARVVHRKIYTNIVVKTKSRNLSKNLKAIIKNVHRVVYAPPHDHTPFKPEQLNVLIKKTRNIEKNIANTKVKCTLTPEIKNLSELVAHLKDEVRVMKTAIKQHAFSLSNVNNDVAKLNAFKSKLDKQLNSVKELLNKSNHAINRKEEKNFVKEVKKSLNAIGNVKKKIILKVRKIHRKADKMLQSTKPSNEKELKYQQYRKQIDHYRGKIKGRVDLVKEVEKLLPLVKNVYIKNRLSEILKTTTKKLARGKEIIDLNLHAIGKLNIKRPEVPKKIIPKAPKVQNPPQKAPKVNKITQTFKFNDFHKIGHSSKVPLKNPTNNNSPKQGNLKSQLNKRLTKIKTILKKIANSKLSKKTSLLKQLHTQVKRAKQLKELVSKLPKKATPPQASPTPKIDRKVAPKASTKPNRKDIDKLNQTFDKVKKGLNNDKEVLARVPSLQNKNALKAEVQDVKSTLSQLKTTKNPAKRHDLLSKLKKGIAEIKKLKNQHKPNDLLNVVGSSKNKGERVDKKRARYLVYSFQSQVPSEKLNKRRIIKILIIPTRTVKKAKMIMNKIKDMSEKKNNKKNLDLMIDSLSSFVQRNDRKLLKMHNYLNTIIKRHRLNRILTSESVNNELLEKLKKGQDALEGLVKEINEFRNNVLN